MPVTHAQTIETCVVEKENVVSQKIWQTYVLSFLSVRRSEREGPGVMNGRHYPCKSETVDGIGQHIAKKRRVGIQSWEVRVHVGWLPVSYLKDITIKEKWWIKTSKKPKVQDYQK